MRIEVRYPSKRLSSIVKCYWILEKESGQRHLERLYPCGETQIIFHYGNPFREVTGDKVFQQTQSIVCGQLTTYKDILTTETAGLFGIIFQPYSINTITHIPSYELSQISSDLIDINGIFKPLESKIVDAINTEERIKVIENFLIQRINIPNNFHFDIVKDSISYLSTINKSITIKKIAENYSLSERQFERIFKEYVGLPPKSFMEIMRFKRAFYLMQKHSDLTHISYTAGYYDQAHFIRTFRKFTGYTPGGFPKSAQ